MIISRGGVDLNRIWKCQMQCIEADVGMRNVERGHAEGSVSDERLDVVYRRVGQGNTPKAISHRYRWRARERDEWNRRLHADEGSGEPLDRGKGRYFTRAEYAASGKSHHDLIGVIDHAREHYGNDAGLHLTPYKGHNVELHLRDVLAASGGVSYDVRSLSWEKDAHPKKKSLVGHVAATTWADTEPEVGKAFDAAFKKHYPHKHSRVETMAVVQDAQNTDNNGRRFTIHPDDIHGAESAQS